MWELEAFAEEAIRCIGATDLPVRDKRDCFAGILGLIAPFDVSFTHFRTRNELEEAQYFLSMPPEQHPDPSRAPAVQALLDTGASGWLMLDGKAEAFLHLEDGQARLFFDPTMALWSAAVASGQLTGLAASEPTVLPAHQCIPQLIARIVALPEPPLELLKMLHGLVAHAYTEHFQVTDPALQEARDQPLLRAALATPHSDWVDQRFDARQALPYMEGPSATFLAWWCQAYAS
jgi:hypothetical protein